MDVFLENYQKAPKCQNIQKFSIFDSYMQFYTVFWELFESLGKSTMKSQQSKTFPSKADKIETFSCLMVDIYAKVSEVCGTYKYRQSSETTVALV